MTGVWAWARRELLRNRRATLALVLLIGLSGAVVLTAAAGARRTGSAFERFVAAGNTADARLQYATETVDDEDIMGALLADPAVEQAVPVYITIAFAEGNDYDLGIYAGPDEALFTAIDIPRILEGRRPDPTDAHEVLVNQFTQQALGVEVGDTITVGTFGPEQFDQGDDVFEEPAGPRIPLTVTGISRSSYDLADPESASIYGTPAFHEQYAGRAAGYGPTLQVATAPGEDPGQVVEGVVADFDLDEVFVTESAEQVTAVSDATRVLAVGLGAFAAVAGLAALVAGAQALHRRMAETADDLPALRSMGFSRRQCTSAVMASALPAVLAGVALAVGLAVLGSMAMPIGSARSAEPSPGFDVDGSALGIGALVLLAFLSAAVLFGAMRTTRIGLSASVATRTRTPAASLMASGLLAPPSQMGVAMALDPGEGRTAVPVRSALLGVAFGVAGVVAALTFGSGLDALVEDPAASGWNWTFSPDVASEDVPTLMAIDGVEDVGLLRYGGVIAEGHRMAGVSMRAERGTPSFTVVEGRMPAGPREIALGPKTAEELGVGIGDDVRLADPAAADGMRELVVVGEILLPVFDGNPFNEGVALTPETLDVVAQSEGFDQYVVGFAAEIPDEEAAHRVNEALPEAMSVYAYPSPPPDVAHLDGVQFLPRVLGVFLGLLALAAVGHALATSVRRRRHDLGIVRALGFVGRDVLRTIAAQSWTLIVIGLVVGIPFGIAIGRLTWRYVADGMGVRAAAGTSLGAITAVALLSGLAGFLLSVLPGLSAARQRTIDALRVE